MRNYLSLSTLGAKPIIILLLTLSACKPAKEKVITSPEYIKEIDTYFEARFKRLPTENSWLNLAGLFWLKEGENTFGSDSTNALVFPKAAPSKAGKLILKQNHVYLDASAEILVNGKKVKSMELHSDQDSITTKMTMGQFRFFVIKRGNEFAIRLRDLESQTVKNFKGVDRYPVSAEFRVRAKFEKYDPEKIIPIPTVIPGYIDSSRCTGALVFELMGETYRLDPVIEQGSDEFFLIFGDKTNGHETYGGGRFLYCPFPDSTGYTTIDFNKAYNPPCVFTTFATCPLPPKQNKLAVEIGAGEKKWEGHH